MTIADTTRPVTARSPDALVDLERRIQREDREDDREFAEYVRERKAEDYKWPNTQREGW